LTSDEALRHVKVFCFYETIAVDVVGFVVPKESATMLLHPNCGIGTDDIDITKFISSSNAGFINIQNDLDDESKRAQGKTIGETYGRAKSVDT
jgi:hypothetical protein